MESEPTATASDMQAGGDQGAREKVDPRLTRRLTLRLDGFTWRALEQEATELGMSIHELASFAVLYYLADRDSGRIARRLPKSSAPEESHPLGKLLGS